MNVKDKIKGMLGWLQVKRQQDKAFTSEKTVA